LRRCPAGSRPGVSSCIRPERPSADRGSALAIEAAGAQARHLWVDLGQALQDQAEIQSRELAGCRAGTPVESSGARRRTVADVDAANNRASVNPSGSATASVPGPSPAFPKSSGRSAKDLINEEKKCSCSFSIRVSIVPILPPMHQPTDVAPTRESLVINSSNDVETSLTAGIGGSSGVKRLVPSQQQMMTFHSFFKRIELDG
jgi:hypothetical protein